MARPKKTARKTRAGSAGTRGSRKKAAARKGGRAKKSASAVARKKPALARKKKKAAKRAGRPAEALPRATVLVDDQMAFEVRWLGGAQARLTSLLDNQRPIEQFPSGSSPLTVTYSVPAALTHTIQWDVLAPGQDLVSITAKATRNGGSLRELNRADSARDRWLSSGVLL